MSASPLPRLHRRRVSWIGSLAVLLTITGLSYHFRPEPQPTEPPSPAETYVAGRVDVVIVESAPFSVWLRASGRLRASRRTAVSPGTSGQLVRRLVEVGRVVRQGQTIAVLDDRDARLDLAEATADLAAAEAQEAKARAIHVADTRPVDGQRSEIHAEAARRAVARGHLTAEEVEGAGALRTSGRRADDVDVAAAATAAARARVGRAELAIARTRIAAPFTGRVSEVHVETGEYVSASTELVTLVDTTPIEVEVDVLEGELSDVTPGTPVLVRVPSLATIGPIEGTVARIDPVVDPTTGAGQVIVRLPNTDGRLRPGLFAEVQIETSNRPDQLVVPSSAVLERDGQPLVFLVEDGRAEWTYVSLGDRTETHIAIVDGIAAGDTIAVSGHFALAQGAPVAVGEVTERRDDGRE